MVNIIKTEMALFKDLNIQINSENLKENPLILIFYSLLYCIL